jgi:hypothetical protein
MLITIFPTFSVHLVAHFPHMVDYIFHIFLLVQTFEYKKLILDYSRDVRRATHDVMTNVVTGAGFDSQFSNACPFSCRDAVPHLLLLLLVSFTWIYVVFLCHE